MSTASMEGDFLGQARARVESRFGTNLAKKATASFCAVFGQESRFALEAASPIVQPRPVIIEYAANEAVSAQISWQPLCRPCAPGSCRSY